MCQIFFARGRPGGAGPFNVNLGPPIISETTRARKLKLKTISCGKVLASGTKMFPLGDVQRAQGPLK